MSGSPPQIETIGALHSSAAPRQSSRLIMSLSEVEYSRMRPQPVQVRLQVCSGSSCRTVANLFVPRSLCPMMWPAIFVVRASGNLIKPSTLLNAPEVSMSRRDFLLDAKRAKNRANHPRPRQTSAVEYIERERAEN